jgi:hypothetical protein
MVALLAFIEILDLGFSNCKKNTERTSSFLARLIPYMGRLPIYGESPHM